MRKLSVVLTIVNSNQTTGPVMRLHSKTPHQTEMIIIGLYGFRVATGPEKFQSELSRENYKSRRPWLSH